MSTDNIGEKVLLSAVDKIVLGVLAALIVMFFNNRNDRYLRMRNASMTIATQNLTILTEAFNQTLYNCDAYIDVLESLKSNRLDLSNGILKLYDFKRKQDSIVNKVYAALTGAESVFSIITAEMQRINASLQNYLPSRPAEQQAVKQAVDRYLVDLRTRYADFMPEFRSLWRRTLKEDIETIP